LKHPASPAKSKTGNGVRCLLRLRALRAFLILPFALAITSCGGDLSVAVSAMDFNRRTTVENFGDSITCGYYATPANGTGNIYSTNGYAGLLDAAIGKPSANFARGGDQAADTSRLWIYRFSYPVLAGQQLYTMLIGTNDAYACGAATGCLLNYQQALLASLAWLALPAGDKVLASSIQTKSGTWSNDLYDDLGTTQAGASLTFTVQQTVAGRPLFLAFRADDTDTGSAMVSIDGVAAGTLYTNPNNGVSLITANRTADTILAAALPLGGVGTHTIRVQTVSAGYFGLMWAGVSTGNYAQTAGAPRVLIGGVTVIGNPFITVTVATYNGIIQTMVGQLVADGLNIQIAPTATALNVATDIVDGIHPNNVGHAKLAAAFESVL
jgi:lysophospholipase L1-like esterase